MEYITAKKFSGLSLSGQTTIASGKTVQCVGGIIVNGEQPVCYATSQNCYDHFARNDDGEGKKRFALTHGILKSIADAKAAYNEAIAEIMHEEISNGEKQAKLDALDNKPARFFEAVNADSGFGAMMKNGVWNVMFYNAGIEALERLDALTKEIL